VAPLAGYDGTSVSGITDSGVMVGSVLSLEFSTRSGFIRGKDGTYAVFSHPEAPFFTEARAVNNDGLVSGVAASIGTTVGFIYDPETDTFTDIVPSILTIAHGINSKGAVVGDARFFNADDPCPGSIDPIVRVGWLRAADGSISYFQVNGLPTAARGINDVGSIVGFVMGPVESKGFVVKLDGSPCQSLTVADNDFLEFPGFNHLLPEGITNSGVIVGIVRNEFSFNHGFIATRR
jgi:hypothetical protein